ncbi:MAG TPA: ABC transporter permease, partial [candidate division Zixibacteria bacterium]|nr:ABC transporter permease [candidate division Zixibacteria bacterium]
SGGERLTVGAVSAIVFAGRVGAGVAAELGTMRVTEQIDALESMGIDPVRFLVMPRILACLTMVPFLVVFANFIAILGGMGVAVLGVDISAEMFLDGFHSSFSLWISSTGRSRRPCSACSSGWSGATRGSTPKAGRPAWGRRPPPRSSSRRC